MPETGDSLTGLPGLVGVHGYGQMSQLPRTAPALMSLHREWFGAKLRSGRKTGTGAAVPGTHYICCPELGDLCQISVLHGSRGNQARSLGRL